MNTQLKYFFLTVLFAFVILTTNGQTTDSLYDNFKTPPTNTKPWIYWYWMSDHISRDGITKDLEAMAKVGIGEAFIGNIDYLDKKGNVKALTEEWWQMVEFAIKEGKRTGVNIGLFNSPGWSQSGGPWIKPEQSMRYLTMSEIRVKGPVKFKGKLVQPTEQFQDVTVLAFASPVNDNENIVSINPKITSIPALENLNVWFDNKPETETIIPLTQSKSFTIDLETTSDYTARSLTLIPGKKEFSCQCEIQYKEKGGAFKTVKSININRTKISTNVGFLPLGPIVETFPAVSSTHYRLIFSKIGGIAAFGEISLSGAARAERYIEKQLAKLYPSWDPKWDSYMWGKPAGVDNKALCVNREKVIDISSHLSKDGQLEWNIPEGEWIIQRIGMTPTGQKNTPASVEATGLEVDKMNSKWVAKHFDSYVGEILNRLPASERQSFKHVIADSYETGAQNWTDGLAVDFQKRYGYDPIPFLPVIFGRVVDNSDVSDRFLWDLRRLIADRISYEYVGELRKRSNENNLTLWLENYGHWGYPGEFLQYGGQSNEIGGEFWTSGDSEGLELKAAASASHTYGKNVVHAEAFTSGGPMWSFDPWGLKKRGDWSATKGINHFILHVYIHQPEEDKIPGINAWFGVEMNRHNTWFFKSKDWIDYNRRTQYMLQQGRYVADVAYFIGEDAPKMTGIRNPELPEGYNFDYINAEVIENRLEVKDGRFVLPDGMTYRVLVLPPQTTMRPEVLRKIKQLIAAGGIVVGAAPTQSPSLENYPSCDTELTQMAREIWQNCDGKNIKKVKFGKGTVYNGAGLDEVFSDLNITSDLGNIDINRFPWIHRSSPDGEIYYISNQTDETIQITPSFRVENLQPELWNPVNKEKKDLSDFTVLNGRTNIQLEFAPRQSHFIVFRKKAGLITNNTLNFNRVETLGEVSGSWKVKFDSKWGAPDSVVFEKLTDWTKRPEDGIKFFSGTAVYQKSFDLPKHNSKSPILLNLGEFHNMATVRLNGQSLGLVWAEPHILDITAIAKKKGNMLEIEITNTWNNRLVGDAALPVEKRLTNVTLSPNANSGLTASGLIGPVLIQTYVTKPFVQKTIMSSDKMQFVKPDKAIITMSCPTADAQIRYTLDGSIPTKKSTLYTTPFEIMDYALIKSAGFKKGLLCSETISLTIEAYNPEINGLNYKCYIGEWTALPDFSKSEVVKSGKTSTLDINKFKPREDKYGVKLTGFINIDEVGDYTLFLSSDDGAKLYIDGILVADNDGSHGEKEAVGRATLTKGKHSISIDYFDALNLDVLRLSYSLNLSPKKEIPLRWLTFE